MFFLGGALILLVICLVLLARAIRDRWRFTRVRRAGVRVTGAVVGHESRERSYGGGYLLIPIVRYQVGERSYDRPVANLVDRVEEGTGMDLVVDPAEPWRPWAVYGNGVRGVVLTGALSVFAALLVAWARASL